MRITLVTGTLGSGGAERVLSLMANYWAIRSHDITLITISGIAEDWYKLHSNVVRLGLNLDVPSSHFGQAIYWNARRVIQLRRALRRSRPNVVISFLGTTNVLTLMASWGLGLPIIVSERNDPSQYHIGRVWEGLRAMLYRRADAVVVQTLSVGHWCSKLIGGKAIHVIPNPVNPELNGSVKLLNRQGSGHTVVAVGRLGRQKGFDLLIQAFARCAAKHVDWSLAIIGEGRERTTLEALVATIGIADRVSLPGRVRDSFPILRGADLFVLSSRYEGFPNVLLEAMACGLPVIAADCPSGPRDIISDGVDGVLVPPSDVDALAAAMDRLMTDEVERQRLGAKALEVTERFSIDKIMEKWGEVLFSLSSGKLKANPSRASVKERRSEMNP